MKKIISTFLLVTVLCSLVGCSSEVTEKYEELVSKYDKLQQKYDKLRDENDDAQTQYDELETKYAELMEKHEALDTLYNDYVAFTESQAVKSDIGFEILGKTMSDEAVTAVMGDVVVMTLPYVSSDKSLEILGNHAAIFGVTMPMHDYKSCLVLFVDGNGDCQLGFNISKSGEISYFIIQD